MRSSPVATVIVLEVAPLYVGSLKSLRQATSGRWPMIRELLAEAENERMH